MVFGFAGVAGPVVMMATSGAQDAPEIGVFNVAGESAGIGSSFGNPASQPNPVAAGLVPNAVAQLGSGPSGYALSSIAWPGPLAGNAGSLANVVGTPLPPDVVANGNDPVKAEAAAGGGNKDEKTVGPMYAVVDGPRSEARTTISNFRAGAAISASRIFTQAVSRLDQGSAISTAETELNGVEVAAGAVKFDSIRTSAKGTTDGAVATTEHHEVVSGFTVAGTPMVVDENGTHAANNNSANPLVPAVDAGNAALKSMHMTIYMTKPSEEHTAAGRPSSTAVLS